MRILTAFLTTLTLLSIGYAETAAPAVPRLGVMPVPATLQARDGRLAVDAGCTASIGGADDGRVRDAVARTLRLWEERAGLRFNRTPAGTYVMPASGEPATLRVECAALAPAVPQLGEDETYTLEITSQQAVLRAPTTTGALRGLATLTQLLQSDANGWFLPALEIHDAPRFAWRGLLIDVCRHWIPITVIKRNLDAMALVKLNVLHFHLTEDQGFRIESKRYPKLHQLGSDGLYYTQDQIREIVAYAAARGIRVVPEFDLPGHATSWVVGYPELASAPGPYQIERRWGVHNPTLDPTNEALYVMLDGFFAEMTQLFPDAYVHIGGDENNGKQWKANAHIQEFIQAHNLKDNPGLQAYFNRRLQEIVIRHGRKMIGWDEILHRDLPSGTVIQSWRGANDIAAATQLNFAAILSKGFYLDHLLPAAKYYANDPIPAGSTLTEAQQKLVLGGEGCIWAEWVTEETIDSRAWPNAAVVAERLWSPRDVTDVSDMYRRLALVSQRLEESGLFHQRNREAMLRRFVGDTISPAGFEQLRELSNLFLAGSLGVRARTTPGATQFTPLTEFADCAVADSAAARAFETDVRACALSATPRPDTIARLSAQLTAWKTLGEALANGQLAPASPRVCALAPLGRSLVEAADLGLAAIHDREQGGTKEAATTEKRLATLAALERPQLGVTFPLVPSLRLLVGAAAAEPGRIHLKPEEWSARVEQLATPPKHR